MFKLLKIIASAYYWAPIVRGGTSADNIAERKSLSGRHGQIIGMQRIWHSRYLEAINGA